MATQRIVLGEWMPDQPGIAGALTVAKNVVPAANGYTPLPSVTDLSAAAPANLINVFSAKFAGTTTLFAASGVRLYKFDSTDTSLDDVSKLVTGSPANYTSTTSWRFTQFGSTVIAANGQDKLQGYTPGTSTNFADLNAAAPSARYITVVRDFVVAAADATTPNRVWWSDINDETDWTPAVTSQSDFQDIPDGGDIVGLTGGEYGLIFLEKAIVRMSYIGSPLFFQFDTISRGLGCFEPRSIAQYGNLSFFLSDDGFYLCDGQTVRPIGAEKVDRFFFDTLNPNLLDQMSTAVDPVNKLVVWCYENDFGGRNLLIYNWQLNRWSYGDTTASFIASAASAGVTLEGLDAYGTMDTLSVSLDSRIWAGGQFVLAGVSGAKIVTFAGQSMAAELVTGDIQAGEQSMVQLVRPQVDNGSASVSVASRMRLDGQITFGAASTASSENRASLRSLGRYHRIKIVPSGAQWKHAVAFDLDIVTTGGR